MLTDFGADDYGTAVAIQKGGKIVVAGYSDATRFPTPSATTSLLPATRDAGRSTGASARTARC